MKNLDKNPTETNDSAEIARRKWQRSHDEHLLDEYTERHHCSFDEAMRATGIHDPEDYTYYGLVDPNHTKKNDINIENNQNDVSRFEAQVIDYMTRNNCTRIEAEYDVYRMHKIRQEIGEKAISTDVDNVVKPPIYTDRGTFVQTPNYGSAAEMKSEKAIDSGLLVPDVAYQRFGVETGENQTVKPESVTSKSQHTEPEWRRLKRIEREGLELVRNAAGLAYPPIKNKIIR